MTAPDHVTKPIRNTLRERGHPYMPGVGPITAMAVETFAPPMAVFSRGRDLPPGLGLFPATFDGRQAPSRQDLEDGPA